MGCGTDYTTWKEEGERMYGLPKGTEYESLHEADSKQLTPLMSLLEWEQKALTGLDADISDLIIKLGPTMSQPETASEPNEKRDTHGSEFAKQWQKNIERIEHLSDTVKDAIRRCDV